MALEREHQYRYTCFCGAAVIGLPVCSPCARRMVAVLLGETTAFPERTETTSSFQGDDVAEELLEPVTSLAV